MALYHALLYMLLLEPTFFCKEAYSLPSTFCAGKPNGVYANPLSCSSFWACWDNGLKGSLLLCPPNTIWSQPSLSCTHTPPSPFSPIPITTSSNISLSSNASIATPSADPSASNTSIASPSSSTSSPFNVSSSSSTSSPLNASFHSSSSTSSTLNASLASSSLINSSSASNSSIAASILPSCSKHSGYGGFHLPIWSWNGLLHCYGYGCLDTQKPNLHSQFEIGIPCLAAQELISIAKQSTKAWIPAPHEFVEGDLNLIGGKHWKIRFDSIEKEDESGLTVLKASITDYSPSQRILDTWQGGPTREAQFALKGPQTSPQGGCYYSISLESPNMGDMWEPFTRDLIKESTLQKRVGPLGSVLSTQGQGHLFGRLHKRRRPKKRRVHTDSVQGCLKIIPWSSLVATALCYASNAGGGFNSVALCSDFSSPDLFSIARCFTSLMGISSELGF